MTKEEKIKRKADAIADLYVTSNEIEKDDAFDGYNLDFINFGISLNGENIEEIAAILGCEIRETLSAKYFTYRNVDYFKDVDVRKELETALNRVKELEQQNISII